ncbi:hypothetical protein DPMN_187460 [Dreissena polymorpha]|uniref:Uncharacterized protein n=1 Tax=Dreissena polymorpha TaxID=45954 RepID=A0A9D4DP32_DREPO|nr:hypothetical protein DPMN_187460 [Dreissena polymorpha]
MYENCLQDYMITFGLSDARKNAVINSRRERLMIDIATSQETRLADFRTFTENDFTSFWQGTVLIGHQRVLR